MTPSPPFGGEMPTRGILVKANFALLNERVEKLIHQKRPLPFRTKLRIAEDEPEERGRSAIL